MVDDKLLSKLSQNLLEVLNDEEYYDITIEVGNDPYIKIFRAHIVILNYRSPHLRRILSTNKKKNDGTLAHVKLSNVSPEIFQVILRYIYGGKIPLAECDTSDIIKILDAANILSLQELIIYLQSFLIENKTKWMEENFDLIYRTSFENNTFSELQKYCTDLISKEPAKIFKSPNISSIPEKLLISIIQNDYLQMNEVQIWEQLIKWGFAQHPELPSDFTNYSKNDFKTLKNTIQQCIPFIRFYNLSSKEFTDNVLPYRKLLPKELYEDLLKTFLTLSDPNSKPENKSRPRIVNNDIKLSLPNYENVSDQVENNKSMVNMTYYPYNWKVTEEDSKKREELRKSKEILKEKLNKLRHSMLKNPTEEQSKWWEVVTEEPKKWEEPTEEQNNLWGGNAWNGNNSKVMNSGGSNDNKGNNNAWINTKVMNSGGSNDNKVNNNAWINPKVMNSGGSNDNKGNNNAWNGNNPKVMNSGGTNDNKVNNNAWINPKVMNSGGTNDNKGNNNAWNGNNSKVINFGGTNDNKGNNNAWINPKVMNSGGTNDNKGNNNVWNGSKAKVVISGGTNDNKVNNNAWNNNKPAKPTKPTEKWVKSAKNPNEKWIRPTVEKPKSWVEPTEKPKAPDDEMPSWWNLVVPEN